MDAQPQHAPSTGTASRATPVILLAFANDRAGYLSGLPKEAGQLRALFDPLERAGRCKLVLLPYTTVQEILDLFQDYRDRIALFHFAGHANHYQLLMESATGALAAADAGGLALFLAQQTGLRLIFLNACSTQGHVQELHAAGAPVVIATDQEIDDSVAADFAARFYRGLAGGATIGTAFAEAEAGMQVQHGNTQRHLLYRPPARALREPTRWPWVLRVRDGDKAALEWRLPPPTNDPRLWVGVPVLPNLDRIVGRQPLLDDLVAHFLTGQNPTLAIDGLPGVGKTTLAILLAHDERVRARFTDGILWAGLGPTPDIPSVQAAWAEALGLELRDVAGVHQRQERLNVALGQRRVLVVIDDAWTLEAAQALRLSSPYAGHLLTTRNLEIARGFAGSQLALKVPALDDETAWAMLQQLAPEACAADHTQARALADAAGGLPLAVELLGGYLAAPERAIFADLSQAALVELKEPARRLALARERLGSAAGGIQSLEAVILLSVEDLKGIDARAVDAFFALGAFAPKPATFDRSAAETVTGASAPTLARLAARNLLEVGVDGSLRIHQVVHDVAKTQMPAEAAIKHRTWYLAEAAQDEEDWQRIEGVYPQVKHAWASTQPFDTETALAFVWTLGIYQERRGLWQDKMDWANYALTLAQADGRVEDSASVLLKLGFIHNALGEKSKALELYHQALPLLRLVNDKGLEATTLNNIAATHHDLGENDTAVEFYLLSLPLRREVGDISGEATTLNNVGKLFSTFGEKDKALALYNQALLLRRKVGDKQGEATTLNNIGMIHSHLGQKHKALEFYNQVLSIRREMGDKVGEATTLNNIGAIHSALGEKDKALNYFNRALPLRRQVRDKSGEATTLNNIGLVYSDLGEKMKALEFYNQALSLRREVGDKAGGATTLSNMGNIYDSLGQKEKALELYYQALPLLRQVGDKGGEAITLNNIALVYDTLGERTKALELYDQALALRRAVGDKSGEATTLSNLGALYDALGEPEKALDYYDQALPLRREVGDKSGEATTLSNIGAVYDALGETEKAIVSYNQALSLTRQVGDKSGEATTLNNIGLAFVALGENHKAVEHFSRALPLMREVGDKHGEAVTTLNLILAHLNLGDLTQARRLMPTYDELYAQLDPRAATASNLDTWAEQIRDALRQ